jgi:glutamate-ammonia-ligase adenylyltransferase
LLAGGRLLSAATVADLIAAYRYLRTIENRIQMIADQQTHLLPADELNRQRLARAMGKANWADVLGELDAQRSVVRRHFEALVFSVGEEAARLPPKAAAELGPLWDADPSVAALSDSLRDAGVTNAAEAARLLAEYRGSSIVRRLDEAGHRRLQALLPALIAELRADDDAPAVLRRLLRVLEAIGTRSSYFALLNENSVARRRFVEVCRGGEFLSQQIAAHPLLLDELIDERVFAEPPSRNELAAELADRVARIDADDPERHVEVLCQFKRAAVFRVAVADLSGSLPLMRVSDRLTDVAELLIEEAMSAAWRQISALFGQPKCGAGLARRTVQVCAVGYGKLGGMELGYASDLDLVFLHDSSGERQETDAATPLDNQVFFVRLAQRIVHILTVHSAAGRLYEVDQRLRPSGKGGMLITQLEAFAGYQRSEAWTWEHQALLHARGVAGSPALRAQFEQLRLDIVMRHVRREGLRDEVRKMRERMRRELSKRRQDEFDLKQDRGGIADIEFLAQYWTLLNAPTHPPVAMFSDTIRQLESLASADLVPQATVDVLTQAYREYRARGHHRSLQDSPAVARGDEFVAERAAVGAIWDAAFADSV